MAASLLSNYFAKKKPNQKLKAESVWFEKSDQEQRGPDVKFLVEQIQVLATILQLAVASTPEGDNVKYFSQLLDLKQKLKSCFQQASAGSQVTQALEHRRGYLLGKRAPIRHEYRETLLSGIPRRNEITQMSINSCKDISNYESGFLSLSEIWQLKSLRLVETARTVPHGDIEHIVKVMFLEKNPRDYLMEDMEVPDDESPVRDITNTSILVVSVSTGSGIFSLISKPPVYPLGTIFPKDLHNYELLPGGNSLFINSKGNMILLNKDQHQLPIGKCLRVRNSPWAFDALGGTENVIGQTFMTSKIPQYQNRKLYFISDDCQLVVVDARDGTQIQSFPVGPFRQDLELAEGKVHLLSERGQIAVMNEKTGGLDILGGIRGLGAREVCCGFRIFEQTVLVHGIDWFSFEVPRNFLVIGQLRRQKINFGEPFFYSKIG